MKLVKNSPVWGLMILPVFFIWALFLRMCFVLAGFNPGAYEGARGYVMILMVILGTTATVVTAYETAPEGPGHL